MIALGIAAALAAATPARLPPVERCTGDAAFDQFRKDLNEAVGRKDAAALRKLVAEDVRVDFGGNGGWEEFASTWGLAEPSTSKLWSELGQVMALGCAGTAAEGRVFPGLFEDMGGDADPFELIVAKPGAVLRSAATDSFANLGTLDWHTARLVEEPADSPSVKVVLADGREGWLRSSDLLSPLGYRLVSELRDGRWRIAAFVAGD